MKQYSKTLFTPLIFSAASTTALRTMISWHLSYLTSNPDVDLPNFAYTLQHRRSTLPYRKTIAAASVPAAIQSLQKVVDPKEDAGLGTRFSTPSRPNKVLGIFTGQGAQWPRMGAELVESSPFAASRIADLDAILQKLPVASTRPSWTLKDQLLAARESSRIAEAALSQPLCTAVQILLVDILHEAGISFTTVVGHSSGEIGAAYAAGFVSAQDAFCIAYFRGLHAKLASSPQAHAPRGAMLAIGASYEDAKALCGAECFADRIHVAAVNSSSSITLSGDEDAIEEVEKALKAEGTFARKLKVDTAYHSSHMTSCVDTYLEFLASCGIQHTQPHLNPATTWISSVYKGTPMAVGMLSNQYWADNMCNTVLFAEALAKAVEQDGAFDVAIEVGPTAALKGPALATMDSLIAEKSTPYIGLLTRGQGDIEELSAGLGFIWTRLGSRSVRFSSVQALLSGYEQLRVIEDLPPYPFDHQRNYWITSRIPNHFKHRSTTHVTNPVLGNPCSEAVTPGEFQWRKILQPNELPWLKGHMLQGQTVFPATGYVSMAIEAIKFLALDVNVDSSINLIKLEDVDIPSAIAFDDDSTSVETIFSVSSIDHTEQAVTAQWACYSAVEGAANAVLNARGRATCLLSPAQPDALPLVKTDPYNLVDIDREQFYTNLSKIGYDYSFPFQGLSSIRRKLGYSVGALSDDSGSGWDDDLVLHPGMLDSALQTIFAAWSYPGDTSIWSLHVPVSISTIKLNPYFTPLGDGGKQDKLQYESFIRSKEPSKLVGDIYLHAKDGAHAFLQFEGAKLVPFSGATPKNDLPMFSHFQYRIASPDGQLAAGGESMSDFEIQMYEDVDRAAYWFARNASYTIPVGERRGLLPHFQRYLSWCDRMVNLVSRDGHAKVKAKCNKDTREIIARVLAPYKSRKDIKFVEVVGDNLIPVIRASTSMLEHMNQDGLLRAFYEENAICSGPTGRWLARVVSQISHRFPSLNIFEVGAGTGATTSAVLREIGSTYTSYAFTDISSGFFIDAEERFAKEAGRMSFETFNMEKEPSAQGFIEGSYDVVVAVNVLHVSGDLAASLSNVRRLLKPGGFLVVGELTSTDLLFSGMTVGTLPGWWIGAESGRPWGPLLNLRQWDSTLKNAGFGGIDTVTPDISASLPMNVFVAQAVNDQVTLLRNPLTVKERPTGVRNDGLAIIGGATLPVFNLGQEIAEVLSHRFQNKQFFDTIEDFAMSDMATTEMTSGPVTVLSLVDLDRPYLEDLTVAKFAALKTLWAIAGTVVWVTCGSRKDSPYSYMMKGIIYTVKTEHPNLSVQIYDLDGKSSTGNGIQQNTATDLAVTLLREHILHEWGMDDGLLWTSEPEIYVDEGKQLITRLLPDVEKNKRYNSQRRDVYTTTNPAYEALELSGKGQGKERALELCKVSPLQISVPPSPKYRTVRITHSLLQSLAVEGAGFLRLCMGKDKSTGEAVIALTNSTDSPATVSAHWCICLPETPTASTLVSVATNIVAERILSLTPFGSTLLVNESDRALLAALIAKASSKNVKITFTTAEVGRCKEDNSVLLHPNFPQHKIRDLIPSSTAVFVHFSRSAASDAVRETIIKCLRPTCVQIIEEGLFSHEVGALIGPETATALTQTLRKTLDDRRQVAPQDFNCINLDDVTGHIGTGEPLTVVDWTACPAVTAKVRPIDSGTLFWDNKTYLFVGMSGELGQSLAEWMIRHGARHVVLTSRTPKVNPMFVDDMKKRYAAVVKPMSLDITTRQSLANVLEAITVTMPCIGGVVNGAMILEDELFANVTLENFSRVTAPKVLGTQFLDQAFHDDTSLDFFIVTSSIASIIGWTGQSNYSAANEWMGSLVCNRKARGVAGSSMNIPAVLGVGYAAHADNFDFDYFESLGHINICEEDLHALFAEAILSGRPGQAREVQAQVGMGVNYVRADLEVKAAHKRDVKFSHFVQCEEKSSQAQAVKASVRVKVQLQTAKGQEEIFSITRDAFLAHLKHLLRLTEEDNLDDSSGLVDQGVDSLVAVDIRAWFLKELGVDVPTLKILGGGPIAGLVKAALEKMPEVLGEASSKDGEPSVVPRALMSIDPVPTAVSPAADASGSSSGSRSPESMPTPRSSSSISTTPSSEELMNKDELKPETKVTRL